MEPRAQAIYSQQLTLTRVPPNCFFEVDDFESPWEFSKPFDFIHARSLAGAVRDFPRFCERIMNNLKPRGWVEFVDFPAELFSDDESRQNAPNISEWCKLLDEASQKFGKDLNVTAKYKQCLIDAGFKNVKEDVYKVRPPFYRFGKHQTVRILTCSVYRSPSTRGPKIGK
jgi:trans-aconitate methyltransferase